MAWPVAQRSGRKPGRPKRLHVYTAHEVADLLQVHRETVRRWIRAGELPTIDGRRPVYVRGSSLIDFLDKRRRARKQPCPPGTMFCCKCRAPRRPALGLVERIWSPSRQLNLQALCETCHGIMNRRCRPDRLAEVMTGFRLTAPETAAARTEADAHLREGSDASVDVVFKVESAA